MPNNSLHPERPSGSERLSAHFLAHELWCRHCHRLIFDPLLLDTLEALRARLSERLGHEVPLHINSGYRCPAYNRTLTNSSSTSQHMLGKAADVHVEAPAMLLDLYSAAISLPGISRCGLGLYPTADFLHIDTRGTAARWGEINGVRTTLPEALRILEDADPRH